ALVPLPRVVNPVLGIDPGGDFHLDRAPGLDPAVAPAGVARVGDDRALSAARPARLLDRQEPLLEHDHALPAAAAARVRLRAGLRPVPAAVAAQLLAGERLGPLDPGRGLDQVDVEHRPHVAAGPRAAPPPAPAAAAEEAADQVAEQVADVHPFAAREPARAGEPGVAVAVVDLPLLRVAEDLVRLGRLLEPDL